MDRYDRFDKYAPDKYYGKYSWEITELIRDCEERLRDKDERIREMLGRVRCLEDSVAQLMELQTTGFPRLCRQMTSDYKKCEFCQYRWQCYTEK